MHTESSNHQILASCAQGYISTCNCCHEYNFTYKNVLLRLPEDDLLSFGNWLMDGRNNPDNYFALPHDRTRVYCSPISNLFLVFTPEELEEIGQLFTQTQLLLEARRITAKH